MKTSLEILSAAKTLLKAKKVPIKKISKDKQIIFFLKEELIAINIYYSPILFNPFCAAGLSALISKDF